MKMNKRKLFVMAVAVCLIAILSFSTLAWFTDTDEVENKFMVAGSEDADPDDIFSVDVWEDDDPDDTDEDEDDKIQDGIVYEEILPGDDLYKEVNVENTGAYPQYIKLTVTVSDASVWQGITDIPVLPIDYFVNIDRNAIQEIQAYQDTETDELVYDIYYKAPLGVDEVYTAFNNVHIDEAMDQYDAAALAADGFYINVVATAIQTENVGDNVIEAYKTVEMYEQYVDADASNVLVSGELTPFTVSEDKWILLDNVTATLDSDAVLLTPDVYNATIIIDGGDFTLTNGAKIVGTDGAAGGLVVYVTSPVTVNGADLFSYDNYDTDFFGNVLVFKMY